MLLDRQTQQSDFRASGLGFVLLGVYWTAILAYIQQARPASCMIESRLADGPAVLSRRSLLDDHLVISHHILYYSACGDLGITAFDGQAT